MKAVSRTSMIARLSLAALVFAPVSGAQGEVQVPAIISDHMVLQQKQSNPIWGWDEPGTKVSVAFAGQTASAVAGPDGRWTVKLDPMPAHGQSQAMVIIGSSRKDIQDVLVGEVWMCSGQSNMEFALQRDWNGPVEAAASQLANLRLIKVPHVGTQEPKRDFVGGWKLSTVDSAMSFSAVGLLCGRYLHQILGVPVGLIDNSWGGSAAEAWVRRASLEGDPRYRQLMENTVKQETRLQTPEAKAEYEKALARHKAAVADAKAAGKPAPRAPQSPEAWLSGNARPGNIFNGMVHPTLGYGIKGVIWYQGEANTGRAWEYAELFPFMIEQWRREWQQGDFPFYWVQLADYMAEQPAPKESAWAELREAQTKALRLPNTGQAVIIDLGEGKDIHPRNKHDVAARLVRWALAKDYGLKIPCRSPEFKTLQIDGAKAIVSMDCFGSKLLAFDVPEARGFTLCGEDKVWYPANGKIVGNDAVELTCDRVAKPMAVRYAWADNPVCNLYSEDGLPVTPFRTDDFDLTTKPKTVPTTQGGDTRPSAVVGSR